jgi:hypothetical protein
MGVDVCVAVAIGGRDVAVAECNGTVGVEIIFVTALVGVSPQADRSINIQKTTRQKVFLIFTSSVNHIYCHHSLSEKQVTFVMSFSH